MTPAAAATAAAAPDPHGTRAALRLAVAQMAPVLRDVPANARALAAAARTAAADLLLAPELSLTGYHVGDAVPRLAITVDPAAPAACFEAFDDVPGQVVPGLIEHAPGGPFNTAVVLSRGRVVFRHRKVYLPTYGMFDEGRWFGRGATLDVWQPAPGWSAGLLVCEDFWHPGLVYALAARGIDLLLVQSAAPGRGVWDGGPHGAFATAGIWEQIAVTTAQIYGVYVALANRVGVEGGVTFAGGSMIVGPDGTVLARAPDMGETTIAVELTRAALETARRPFSHLRDDDPRLVVRELERGLVSGAAAAPRA